jgi:ionotropic glutamate receptor
VFLSQESGNISCNCGNVKVMYVRPIPNEKYTLQYKELKENYNLTGQPAISAAFYFDVALRTFLATK